MKNALAATALALVVAVISFANHEAAAHTSATALAPAHKPTTAPPALAARFELTSRDPLRGTESRSMWHLVRADQRVEAYTLGAPSYEVWERDDRGEVTLKRVFDADRRLVEYSSTELRAGGRLRPWEAIVSVVDPQLLGTMQRAGVRKTTFGTAQVYRHGTADGKLEVWWLADRRLPARVLRTKGNERLDLRLRELRDRPARHWNTPSAASREDYLVIDWIDFGDMHNDPFVHKVEWMDSQARPFGTTQHRH